MTIAPDLLSEPIVPSIPDYAPDNLYGAVDALVRIAKMREFPLGDPLDRSVTWRDLAKNGQLSRSALNGQLMAKFPGYDGTTFFPVPVGESDYLSPPAVKNLVATGALTTVLLTFDQPQYHGHAYVEVWRSGTNDLGTAVLIGTTEGDMYADILGLTGVTRYYWVRAVSLATLKGPFNATAGVAASTGFVTTNDLSDLIITANKIAAGAINAYDKFAGGLRPVGIGGVLPTLPSATYPTGSAFFLTTDTKLYRVDATGNSWTKAVDGGDITANTITAGAIAAGAIIAGKIGANAIVAGDGVIANAAISTALIQDAAITNAKIGLLAVDTARIADAAISAAKIALATITSAQIALATITAAQIALATITGAQIANATITNALIANATILGGNIAASTITGGNIAAATITATNLSVATLSAISANLGTITAGNITLDTAGFIKGGQTAYNTGAGFFLGYSGAAYKFSIGDGSLNSLTWDGTTLSIVGKLSLDPYTAGATLLISNGAAKAVPSNGAMQLLKQTKFVRAGTLTVTYSLYRDAIPPFTYNAMYDATIYLQVYVNGVAAGSLHTYYDPASNNTNADCINPITYPKTTLASYSENITIPTVGSTIEVYGRVANGSTFFCSSGDLHATYGMENLQFGNGTLLDNMNIVT